MWLQLSPVASIYLSNIIPPYFAIHTISSGHSGVHTFSTNTVCLYFCSSWSFIGMPFLFPLEAQILRIFQGSTSPRSSVFIDLRLLSLSFFFKILFADFREREREQGEEQKEGEEQTPALSIDPNERLDPRTLRSLPEPKSRAGHSSNWDSQAPLISLL